MFSAVVGHMCGLCVCAFTVDTVCQQHYLPMSFPVLVYLDRQTPIDPLHQHRDSNHFNAVCIDVTHLPTQYTPMSTQNMFKIP